VLLTVPVHGAEVEVHGFGERPVTMLVVTPVPIMVMPFVSGSVDVTADTESAVPAMDPVITAPLPGVAAEMVVLGTEACEMLTVTPVHKAVAGVHGLGVTAVMTVPVVMPAAVNVMPMASEPTEMDVTVRDVPVIEPTKVAVPRAVMAVPAATLVPDRVWLT
jgi:hypothetical protein